MAGKGSVGDGHQPWHIPANSGHAVYTSMRLCGVQWHRGGPGYNLRWTSWLITHAVRGGRDEQMPLINQAV